MTRHVQTADFLPDSWIRNNIKCWENKADLKHIWRLKSRDGDGFQIMQFTTLSNLPTCQSWIHKKSKSHHNSFTAEFHRNGLTSHWNGKIKKKKIRRKGCNTFFNKHPGMSPTCMPATHQFFSLPSALTESWHWKASWPLNKVTDNWPVYGVDIKWSQSRI